MVSNAISLNASTYKTLFATGTGSLSVPVNPSAVVYAQFNHVHGIAARSGQEGVPVSKVKILNTLIDQLVSMKSKSTVSKENVTRLSEPQMDSLIKQYQQKIQTSVTKSTKANTYGFAGLLPEPGALFSIRA